MSAPVLVKVLDDGRIELRGGTYPLREAIRAHGGRWNPEARVWTLPAGTDTSFVPVAVPVPVVAAAPAAAAAAARPLVFAPRRRDGRCCDTAVAFWPADDPYSHYGPAHYRCPHHGEMRSNYTGT